MLPIYLPIGSILAAAIVRGVQVVRRCLPGRKLKLLVYYCSWRKLFVVAEGCILDFVWWMRTGSLRLMGGEFDGSPRFSPNIRLLECYTGAFEALAVAVAASLLVQV